MRRRLTDDVVRQFRAKWLRVLRGRQKRNAVENGLDVHHPPAGGLALVSTRHNEWRSLDPGEFELRSFDHFLKSAAWRIEQITRTTSSASPPLRNRALSICSATALHYQYLRIKRHTFHKVAQKRWTLRAAPTCYSTCARVDEKQHVCNI